MLVVVLSVAVGLFTIDAEGDCPTGDAVAAALKPLLQDTRSTSSERVGIRSSEGGLTIQFIDAAGVVTGKRWLAATADCAERARSAAVVIAAQQFQLSDGGALPAPDLARPQAMPESIGTIRRTAPPRPSRLAYDMSAAFVSGVASDGSFAPGASVAALLGEVGGHFAGHLAVSGTGQRTIAVGSGQALWTRLALSLGAAYRIRSGGWITDVTADAVAALLLVDGKGFALNATTANFDPGLAVGVRAGYRWRRVMPFVGVGVTGWLRDETVSANQLVARADLPRLDVLVMAGASFGDF
jgi:hypothetical protein